MKLKLAAAAALATVLTAPAALADLVIPWFSYRTGPYAYGGIPLADGFTDYFTMLNERDGGIGGVEVRILDCETGYNTQKGVECYESTKGEGSLVYSPLSTGTTYQLIPKATADDIPIHSMGYGRTAAADGTVFSHVFNFPAHYWDGASIAVKHILDVNDGDISGKSITLLFHNSAYGKEPIRTLEELSAKHGFEFKAIPIDPPGQEQKSQWLEIRRSQPDYLLIWGWGIMNPTAVQEAANIRFPMENFIGVWWSGAEADVGPAGERAHGYKALALHAPGTDFPLFDDIKTYVHDRGLAAGAGDQFGTVLYNRAVYGGVLITEAIRTAQEMHGVAEITPAMMRDGLENLDIDEARMAEIGLPNFGPPVKITCENHGGQGIAMVQQWDAHNEQWNRISDMISSDKEIISALIKADADAYAAENNIERRC